MDKRHCSIRFQGYHVVSLGKTKHVVMYSDMVQSEHKTHALAWKALDRLQGEPVNPQEKIAHWIEGKD